MSRARTQFPAIVLRRPNGRASGTGGTGKGQIGIDYIPNMNAGMTIVAPFQRDDQLRAHLSASGLSDAQIPSAFSWTNPDQVKKYRGMSNFDASWIMSPPNQSSCGSCWAVSATSALTDRLSIANQKKFPILSAVCTASCATNQSGADGCNGGWPSDAGCFFEQVGVPSDDCWPYAQFCNPEGKGSCSTVSEAYSCCGDSSSQLRSSSGDQGDRVDCVDFASRVGKQCGSSPGNASVCQSGSRGEVTRYKAVPGSTASLASGTVADIIRRMKVNIFSGGPIVGCYFVYGDFMLPTSIPEWGWKQTNGVYIHASPSPYVKDPWVDQFYQNRSSSRYAQVFQSVGIDFGSSIDQFRQNIQTYFDQMLGGHAVTLVGWDSQDVPGLGQTPYWIVRNSWGTHWNEKGFFRIAMSDPSKNLNTASNMERTDGLGGATVFAVATPTGALFHPLDMSDKSKKTLKWVLIGGGALLAAFLIYYYMRRGSHKKPQ